MPESPTTAYCTAERLSQNKPLYQQSTVNIYNECLYHYKRSMHQSGAAENA